jgi:hypothetical protein
MMIDVPLGRFDIYALALPDQMKAVFTHARSVPMQNGEIW